MAAVADFIAETTTTTGTGAITLAGPADGYGSFVEGFGSGTTIVYYAITNGNNRESGIGSFNGTSTLTRTTPLTTLVSGTYDDTDPTAITLAGTSIVRCTPLEHSTTAEAFGLPAINPSLNLDFANTKDLDPRIIFERASIASYTDDKCKLAYVESDEARFQHDSNGISKGLLIEEARTNLITYSEIFDDSDWTKSNVEIDSITRSSPDRSTNAVRLISTAANATVKQAVTTTAIDFTASFFIKRISGTGDVDITADGTTWVTQTITSDWVRFSITQTGVAGTSNPGVRIVTSGDVIELSCGQIEAGSSITTYIPSANSFTSRNSIGTYYDSAGLIQTAIAEEERTTYNPGDLAAPSKLLLEELRTNLLTYSEDFNTTWVTTRASITVNDITAPDGTTTADKLVEDNTASATHRVIETYTGFTSGVTYTFSVYAKADTRTWINLLFANAVMPTTDQKAFFDLTNGVIGTVTADSTADMQYVGNGWYRCSMTSTADVTSSSSAFIHLASVDNTITYSGDGTSGLHIWGAQLEVGDYATSYVPTVASTVSRLADVSTSSATTRVGDIAYIDGINFSDFYNQIEGTLLLKYSSVIPDGGSTNFICQVVNSTALNKYNYYVDSAGECEVDFYHNNVSIHNRNYSNVGVDNVLMIDTYSSGFYGFTANGNNIKSDASTELANDMETICIGSNVPGTNQINGTIQYLIYYPKQLTDTELKDLTLE